MSESIPYKGRAVVTFEMEGPYDEDELMERIEELRGIIGYLGPDWILGAMETEVTGGPVGDQTDWYVDEDGVLQQQKAGTE